MTTARKPKAITHVYDNGGKTADRYTIVTDIPEGRGMFACIGMSSAPTHPQGVSQWSSCQVGRHLGKKIPWAKLPAHIHNHAAARVRG
jgi:hypothetical protein